MHAGFRLDRYPRYQKHAPGGVLPVADMAFSKASSARGSTSGGVGRRVAAAAVEPEGSRGRMGSQTERLSSRGVGTGEGALSGEGGEGVAGAGPPEGTGAETAEGGDGDGVDEQAASPPAMSRTSWRPQTARVGYGATYSSRDLMAMTLGASSSSSSGAASSRHAASTSSGVRYTQDGAPAARRAIAITKVGAADAVALLLVVDVM
jgi:hypothetical protein